MEGRGKDPKNLPSLRRRSGCVDEFFSSLEHRCSVTGKKNSKGNMEWFIGYKAHIAVDDSGIIVAHHVTGASVQARLRFPL